MESILDTGRDMVSDASAAGAQMRVLGGAAVALRCPSALSPPLARSYGDVDFLARSRDRAIVVEVMAARGWPADTHFNAVNGHRRLLFTREDGDHVDVFLDEFSMCHRLELKDRLGLAEQTIPLSDLVLTKLQIAQLNHKDLQDLAALLIDHRIGDGPDDIDAGRLAEVLCSDWGWWRTVGETVGLLRAQLGQLELDPTPVTVVSERLGVLEEILAGPKSRRWKLRARVGERVPWREDPEEVER
jgi:hypothetical protein